MQLLATTILISAALTLSTSVLLPIKYANQDLAMSKGQQKPPVLLAMSKGQQKPPVLLAMSKGQQKPPVLLAMSKGQQKPPMQLA
jgi:hypothetical protein